MPESSSKRGIYLIAASVTIMNWPDSFHDRLHHRVLKIAVQLTIRIIGLNHHDPHNLLFGIHPEVSSVCAIPSETARRHAVAGANWIGDHLHAQTITTAGRSPLERVGHKR